MTRKHQTKLIHEGEFAAEVDVELIEDENGWSPYLSLEDAKKLEAVRGALKVGDVERASRFGRIFRLTPVKS